MQFKATPTVSLPVAPQGQRFQPRPPDVTVTRGESGEKPQPSDSDSKTRLSLQTERGRAFFLTSNYSTLLCEKPERHYCSFYGSLMEIPAIEAPIDWRLSTFELKHLSYILKATQSSRWQHQQMLHSVKPPSAVTVSPAPLIRQENAAQGALVSRHP